MKPETINPIKLTIDCDDSKPIVTTCHFYTFSPLTKVLALYIVINGRLVEAGCYTRVSQYSEHRTQDK